MAKQLKEIEIPFEAKDSELYGWEYTIPEGMEATIVDNKIVVKKKESEDERIRKEMIEILRKEAQDFPSSVIAEKSNSWITWLEKQGEQKPAEYTLKQAANIFLDALSNTPYNNKPITDAQVITKELLKFLSDASSYNPNALDEQKPADKVEPKFKVGDMVKHKDNPYLTYILKRFTDDGDYEFHAIGKDGHEGCTCFSVVKYQDEWELVEQKPADKVESKYEPKFKIGDTVKDPYGDLYHIAEIMDNSYKTDDGRFILFMNEDAYELHNPVTKIEPKFHEGDWIIDDDELVFRVTIYNNKYQLETSEGKSCRSSYKNIEKKFRLWIIQDAKPGDILEFVDHEKVVVGIVSFVNEKTGKVDVSCLLEDDKFKIGNFYTLDTIKPHPATREQCELLFQKMHEAGYEWNIEKKELKKIDNEIEIPFGAKDSELQEATYYIPKGFHAEMNDDKVVIKKGEKPIVWSEEDDKQLETVIQYSFAHGFLSTVDWLKNLKDRVQSQPKQEWKPTKEQMDTLEYYMHTLIPTIRKEVLFGLYSDLREL